MYIYKTTNKIDGKIYIGQSSYNYEETLNYLGSGKYLKRAIKKYGKENFKKELIQDCNNIDDLNLSEIYWIKKYNSIDSNIGYNIQLGGNQKGKHSDETRKLLSENQKTRLKNKKNHPMYGKKHSEETKNKMKINHADFNNENNPFFGKTHSEESKDKYRKSRKENYDNHKYKTKEYRDKLSKLKSGKNNPAYGRKWMNNGICQVYSKKEDIDKYLNDGYAFGMLNKKNYSKGKWMNNGKLNLSVKIEDINKYLNDGYVFGMLKRK